MSVRRIKNHGKWIRQARVAFQGSGARPSGPREKRRARPR